MKNNCRLGYFIGSVMVIQFYERDVERKIERERGWYVQIWQRDEALSACDSAYGVLTMNNHFVT